MRTRISSLIAAVGTALLVPGVAGAADSSEWLQRQFSTDHRETVAHRGYVAGPAAHDRDGLAYAETWLRRQLAGETQTARFEGIAGRAGPTDMEGTAPLSDAWLRQQFSTDHR